ncbi:copper-binding protein [Comamonas composti]|uniref:copper-binding protein n=1 Tax=Comamonas composti TaxID=408558 RepID=UPI00040DD527|nr:copper-binding protein [Comamonas composti]
MRKKLTSLWLAIGLCSAVTTPVLAEQHASHGAHAGPQSTSSAGAQPDIAMTAGEITRVDARSGKLGIRHAEIRNLDMPPMSMVFSLKDPAAAARLKPGDKVLFHAEDDNGRLVVTHIERAQP